MKSYSLLKSPRSVGLLLVVGLAGCSSVLETDKVNYKSETEGKAQASLEVPPDLSKINRNKRYEMPNGKFSANQQDDGKVNAPMPMAPVLCNWPTFKSSAPATKCGLKLVAPLKPCGPKCATSGKNPVLCWRVMNNKLA